MDIQLKEFELKKLIDELERAAKTALATESLKITSLGINNPVLPEGLFVDPLKDHPASKTRVLVHNGKIISIEEAYKKAREAEEEKIDIDTIIEGVEFNWLQKNYPQLWLDWQAANPNTPNPSFVTFSGDGSLSTYYNNMRETGGVSLSKERTLFDSLIKKIVGKNSDPPLVELALDSLPTDNLEYFTKVLTSWADDPEYKGGAKNRIGTGTLFGIVIKIGKDANEEQYLLYGTVKQPKSYGALIVVGNPSLIARSEVIVPKAAGHGRAGAIQKSLVYADYMESAIELFISRDPARRDFWEKNKAEILAPLITAKEEANALNKIIVGYSAATAKKEDLSAAITAARAAMVGTGPNSIVVLGRATPGGAIVGQPSTLDIKISSWKFFPLQNALGNSTLGNYEAQAAKFVENMAAAALQKVINGFFISQSSSSLIVEALFKEIYQALLPLVGKKEALKVLKAIKTRKPKDFMLMKVGLPVAKKLEGFKKYEAAVKKYKMLLEQEAKQARALVIKADRERLRRFIKIKDVPRATEAPIDYNNIVQLMNKYIREAVIEEMGPSSLVNRTGKFASSVKITRASEKSMNFVYEKNPYGVFKSVGGDERVNHPRSRDPGRIIRAAIRNLASNNLQEFFKDKLYIRED